MSCSTITSSLSLSTQRFQSSLSCSSFSQTMTNWLITPPEVYVLLNNQFIMNIMLPIISISIFSITNWPIFKNIQLPPSPPQTTALPKTVANLSRRSISPGSDLSSPPPATKKMHCRVPIFVEFLRAFVNICHICHFKIDHDDHQSVNSVFHERRSFLFLIQLPYHPNLFTPRYTDC